MAGFSRLIISLCLVLLLTSTLSVTITATTLGLCTTDAECEMRHRKGSHCLENGNCSNPFVSGCIRSFQDSLSVMPSSEMGDTGDQGEEMALFSKRICNSDDYYFGNSGFSMDHCQSQPISYPEIRIHNGNWESPMFYSWIIQIILSEFLHVPTTVGLSVNDTTMASFYNPSAVLSYSTQAYAFEEMKMANRLDGHCSKTQEPCVHVSPEVWIGQEKRWLQALDDGSIDQVVDDGQMGKISWYIPHYTARRFPEFVSFQGLEGSREELARTFRRPTTWADYCRLVSPTKCSESDDVASRKPSEEEEELYFASDHYIGHFRATEENDCNLNPETCTGHITGPGCSWDTYVEAQAYHHKIALESNGNQGYNGGYAYQDMIQIWRAANATKSDIVMWWWRPDATIEEFRGTDFEFQRILLPDPTLKCRQRRIDPTERCSEGAPIRRGGWKGACDNEFNSLQKVIARSLRDMTYQVPLADQSPGYQTIVNLKITQLQMSSMLRKWVEGGRTGLAAREAVCEFVHNNKDDLINYFPRGFPRKIQDGNAYKRGLLYVSQALGVLAAVYVILATTAVGYWRNAKPFAFAERSFIFLILLGLFLVSVASVLYSQEPQDDVCVSQAWMVTLGFTMKLVPLLVKVSAINRLLISGTQRFRRIRIEPRRLLLTVAGMASIAAVYLMVWSIVDPPRRQVNRYLTAEESSMIVLTSCRSNFIGWPVVALCWEALLIIAAVVLAFQSRKVKGEFNSSTHLGILIYSHFVLFALRALLLNATNQNHPTQPNVPPGTLAAAVSFLLSADIMTAVTFYVVPKLVAAKYPEHRQTQFAMSSTVREIENLAREASMRYLNSTTSGAERNSETTVPEFEQEFMQIFGAQKNSSQIIDDRDDSTPSTKSFASRCFAAFLDLRNELAIPDDSDSVIDSAAGDLAQICDDIRMSEHPRGENVSLNQDKCASNVEFVEASDNKSTGKTEVIAHTINSFSSD